MRFPFYLLGLLILVGCSKEQSAQEWKPQDHDHEKVVPPAASSPTAAVNDAYQAACASCHGIDGKGDVPMGRSLRAHDLSSVAWQERVSDEEIAQVIVKGKGKMPAFDLPPEQVNSLVKKVRSFRR